MKNQINLILFSILFILFGMIFFDVLISDTSYVTEEGGNARLYLAAVTESEDGSSGTIIPLDIEVKKGTGKILVNIDNPLFIIDTQQSMKLSVQEAGKFLGRDLSNYDVMFSLGNATSLISGPSAGAAMTVGTIAALTNTELRDDAVITGGISYGGRVTSVGGIKEKAEAARDSEKNIFLVPLGESVERQSVQTCTEKDSEGKKEKRCIITYESVTIEDLVGIKVVEVGSIHEALANMIKS